jgi:hypothetical protein
MSNLRPTPVAPGVQASDAGGIEISETRVKQGRRGTHTFVVLAVSTALAVILVFALWFLLAGTAKRGSHIPPAVAARAFDQGPSHPKVSAPDSRNPT